MDFPVRDSRHIVPPVADPTIAIAQRAYGSWLPHERWNRIAPDPVSRAGSTIEVGVFWLKLSWDLYLANGEWNLDLHSRYTANTFLPDVTWVVRVYHVPYDPLSSSSAVPVSEHFATVRPHLSGPQVLRGSATHGPKRTVVRGRPCGVPAGIEGETVPPTPTWRRSATRPLPPRSSDSDDEPVEAALSDDELDSVSDNGSEVEEDHTGAAEVAAGPAEIIALRPPKLRPIAPTPFSIIRFPAGPIVVASPTGYARVKVRIVETSGSYKSCWRLDTMTATRVEHDS
ncbi:hypothetical protein BC828DRAFT_50125 [Blastocladiella britannica]|nr:hypothetical protein BC828DRAFT_50125 [Blastocladiella britannica]